MSKEAMNPFGLALEAYYQGNENAKIIFHRDDGQKKEDFIKGYFRNYSNFSEREKVAIKNCKGKILDIGAGVGPHALELQKRGHNIIAIDICEKACIIMKKRGVKKVKCQNPYEIQTNDFDTLLILGCSIGFVEDLNGLKEFLEYAKSLLNPEGIILMDSRDIRMTNNQKHIDYHQANIQMGKYRGEIRLRIEFEGIIGKDFQILHIDPDKLREIANITNWDLEILSKESTGIYLGKLKKRL